MRKKVYLRILPICVFWFASTFLGACERETAVACSGDPPNITRPDFWTRESHCRGVLPDYDEVFNADVLHVIEIEIDENTYETMMDEVKQYQFVSMPDLDAMSAPLFVPVNVNYNGKLWTQVGMRWKGHASLQGVLQEGIKKMAFILDFDYYEEAEPNLLNQRFYGFKRLIFSNAYEDPSFIREKVTADIFRASGVPTARSTFAPVYIDWGEGKQYMGLYTLTEDPSDKMLEAQFGSNEGSLYKPWGNAARWLANDVVYPWQEPEELQDLVDGGVVVDEWEYADWEDDIEQHFEKCTDINPDDWSDIKKVINELHEDRDIPEVWRAHLEEVFNVDSFIKFLAVNQAIMNWDSYGCMHHNYYVYADPMDGRRFTWFPWDFNLALMEGAESGCPPPGSVMLDEIVNADEDSDIDADWPLIQYILADDVYRERYKQELKAVLDGPFAIDTVFAQFDKYHDLVGPYVVGPQEKEEYPYTTCPIPRDCEVFKTSVDGEDGLKEHVKARHAAVKEALGL